VLVVTALGGNALLRRGEAMTAENQRRNVRIAAESLAPIAREHQLVITHGNGPQVGDLLTRNELTSQSLPRLPLDVLVAQTEGSLGYFLQRALLNELRQRNIMKYVVTMVTQVLVSLSDPAFSAPSKPVGPVLPHAEAEKNRDAYGWTIGEDKGRNGWRRLVPSPGPVKIVQADMIREAVRSGNIVIAAGGGGIPVATTESGDYAGVEAVIDKDLTSGVLATDVGAELLVILTAVDGVYLDFREENERRLGAVTMQECEHYIAQGHFPAGSMGPKVEAMYGFLQRGGRRGLITSADRLQDALGGRAGTHFIGSL
jgi:carbamate kinase